MPTLSLCEKEIILQTNFRKSAVELIKYKLTDELVSSDIVRSSAPAIFDSKATLVKKIMAKMSLFTYDMTMSMDTFIMC